MEFYEKYRQNFEYDNEFVLIALENKNGIFNKGYLEKVNALTNDLNQLSYVKQVISPTNLKMLSLGGLAPVQTKVLHYDNPDLYKDDSTAIYNSGEFVGSFFPKNAKSLSIYIKTRDELSKVKSDSLANQIV
ncbi:MAG TPA: hypothetical protein PLC65_15085, partial [Bacteroidia bacterium]|nr:hypothetical protein [Bacteroidia bacterium]